MRSRFTAFARGDVDHLVRTSVFATDPLELEQAVQGTRWVALRVLAAPEPVGDQGEVEFAAWHDDPPGQLHERSTFVRRDGRWFYRDGVFLKPVAVRPRDPCWCGSRRQRRLCHP